MTDKRYDHRSIEQKWQEYWLKHKTFSVQNPESQTPSNSPLSGGEKKKPKYYVLDMFPYPSGAGLHVGHPEGYTATDIISRYKRMRGYNVLHPMGWDAFGLPAENYAIKTGQHPEKTTQDNIATFKRQIQSLGFSYDWGREFSTTDSEYYKHTQWIFLQMFKRGLLYEKKMPMNWCPKCRIVAANEEVENGCHERCGSEVEKRDLTQWMFRITDYAERLLQDLDELTEWPEKIIAMQKNWIGKSEGIEIEYPILFEEAPDDEFVDPNIRGTNLPYDPALKEKARELRNNLTAPERKLWFEVLKNKFFEQLKFLRQKPIDTFIVDFYCPELMLVVEIDGDSHSEQEEYDAKRTEKLESYGIKVVRYTNAEVMQNLAGVYDDLFSVVEKRKKSIGMTQNPPTPLNRGAEAQPLRTREVACDSSPLVKGDLGDSSSKSIICYTTRPDTNFGATFVVLAPEHEFLKQYLDRLPNKTEVEKYIKDSVSRSDIDRMAEGKKKTGVFTGLYVINRLNDKKLPLYVGDFVLANVGTGAVVGVPGHDLRDFEFAQMMGIDVIRVVVGKDGDISPITRAEQVQEEAGTMINSEFLDGLPIMTAKEKIMDYLVEQGQGEKKVNYKLRDWIFTRQRYWGEPIPLVKDEEGNIYPLDESELPVKLPEANTFLPTEDGQSPLAKIPDWVEVRGDVSPSGSVKLSSSGQKKFFRETSTMPNWAGSNWYWLRFMDAKNESEPWSKTAENYWGPVDLYVGGAEHAVLHLLYSRFWHKVFYDMGLVHTKEPFKKLMNQGLILAEDGQKMSKSLGNVVNPDEIVERYGADTLRMYEMFMGPFEQSKAWSTGSVEGTYKFLQRIWRLFQEKEIASDVCPGKDFQKLVHKTIKKVTHDIEEFKFNTAISQMMILVNAMQKLEFLPVNGATKFVKILAPFAPHLAEELWQSVLRKTESISKADWPEWDEALTQDDEIDLAVQVNGKLRATISVPVDIAKADAFAQAKQQENVQKFLEAKEIIKEIYVPGKIVNFVVR